MSRVRYTIGLLSALCFLACTSGPATPPASTEFERGQQLLEREDPEAAKLVFERLAKRKDVETILRGRALLGLAQSSSMLDDHKAAVHAYRQTLALGVNDIELNWKASLGLSEEYQGAGQGDLSATQLLRFLENPGAHDALLEDDEYPLEELQAVYRHFAAVALADLYVAQERYVLAHAFLAASRDAFPYRHFCANAYMSQEVRSVLRESEILSGLGRPDEALRVLLPHVLAESNGSRGSVLIKRAVDLIRASSTEHEIRSFIEASLASIRISEDAHSQEYTTVLRDQEVPFFSPGVGQNGSKATQAELQDHLRGTAFFRALADAGALAEGGGNP